MFIPSLHSDHEYITAKRSCNNLIHMINIKDLTKDIINNPLLKNNKKCVSLTWRCDAK